MLSSTEMLALCIYRGEKRNLAFLFGRGLGCWGNLFNHRLHTENTERCWITKITTRKLTKESQLSNSMAEWLPTICEQTDRQSQAADRHRPTVRQNSYRQTDRQSGRQTVKRTDTHTNTDSKKSTSAQGRQKRHPYLHSLEKEIHSYSIWLLFCGSVRNILQKHQNQNTRNAQEKQVT